VPVSLRHSKVDLPSPVCFGIPQKFADWRGIQAQAISASLASQKRFVFQSAPTGTGKSLMYVAEALMTGQRTVILTSTKGLQSQLVGDFQESGLVDIRGMGNYPCKAAEDFGLTAGATSHAISCEEGPCRSGLKCSLKDFGCSYYDAYRVAQGAGLVVTNYAYWMTINKYGEGLGHFDLLVMDEGHNCVVAGTDVGGTPIEKIEVGDWVPSCWRGCIIYRRVVQTFRSRPTHLLRLWCNGRPTICTENHPVLTHRGWVSAGTLRIGDLIRSTQNEENLVPQESGDEMSLVSRPGGSGRKQAMLGVAKEREGILLGDVRPILPEQSDNGARAAVARTSVPLQKDQREEQPNEVGVCATETESDAKSKWSEAANSRRVWESDAETATDTSQSAGLAVRSSGTDRTTKAGETDQLQDRHCKCGTQNRSGSRRQKPRDVGSSTRRPSEGEVLGWTRLDGVEVLKPTSDGEFGGLCPGGYVYNLEVEDTHNYIANGIVMHNSPDELSNFLAVEMEMGELETVLGDAGVGVGTKLGDWQKWAAGHASRLAEKIDRAQAEMEEARENGSGRVGYGRLKVLTQWKKVSGRLKSILGAKGEWVYERQGRTHRFDPVWPGEYAEGALFRGIKKVAVFSATLRPKTAEVLGVRREEMEFLDWPSPFPVSRRPIYHVPTVQMNHRTAKDGDSLRRWMTRIDQILRQRQDRKGIVHCVSYERRNYILQNSEFAGSMISHDSRGTRLAVEKYKKAEAPAVLVSPSVGTGFDFPGSECRFIIIGKLPYPDLRSEIMKVRRKRDGTYYDYLVAQNFVQMAGRGMRSEDDWCEVLVIDDNCLWHVYRYKSFYPTWFMDSFQPKNAIPPPLGLDT